MRYETPGVYYERVDAAGPGIAAVRTDIAAFVGIARRGPVDTPTPIQSWRQFQAYFGDFTGQGFLAYSVRAFFENGGRRCWVVRVASPDTVGGVGTAAVTLRLPTGQAVWTIEAFSPGAWGNALTILVRETHRAQTVSIPAASAPEATAVIGTGEFRRKMLVRIAQGGRAPIHKVVSEIDPDKGRLVWQNPKVEQRLPYDAPLALPAGYDPSAPLFIDSIEYTLTVKEAGTVRAVFEGLSLVPEDVDNYGPSRLRLPELPTGFEPVRTIPLAPPPVVVKEARARPLVAIDPIAPTPGELTLTGGADGLTLLRADDFIGEESSPLDSDAVRKARRRGLRTLNDVDEVAIVAIPDIHVQPIRQPAIVPLPPCVPDPCLPGPPPPPAKPHPPVDVELPPVFTTADIARVQAALVQHCEERRDRIALLDPPLATIRDDALGVAAIRAWRRRFESKYAALYYPWVRVSEPLRPAPALTRDIPPSGHIAGQYARTDFETGVHKAPANAPLVWAQDVTAAANDAVHGQLNTEGINALRAFPGRGLRIVGARTVSSDPDWRYVNVRRLLMMIEKAVFLSIQWAVFEPNDDRTRLKLRLSLTSFLIALWQRGALMGDAIDKAFFVKCDDANNPPQERANGRMLAEVGVAPSQPFEFVVLRVGRTLNEFEIQEAQFAPLA